MAGRVVRAPSAGKPKLLDEVRDVIRRKHYNIGTEETYIDGIKRFIIYHGKRHPGEMAEAEITALRQKFAIAGRARQHSWTSALPKTYASRSGAHRYAGGALEFAPADPGTFDGAQDCFPNAVTEHGAIDQAHRQNSPGAYDRLALEHAGERGEEHIHCQKYYDER